MPLMSTRLQRNLPNALTILRLILAAAFFLALNLYDFPDGNVLWAHAANALFVLAVITDALDGYLARKWDVVSAFGRLMDPFCDKVLVLGAFIYLAGPNFEMSDAVAEGETLTMASGLYTWMVILILARELLVTGIRGVIESAGVSFGSMLSGKLKMILQSIIIPIILLLIAVANPAEHDWSLQVIHILMLITVIVTVWSGMPYINGMRDFMRNSTKSDAPS